MLIKPHLHQLTENTKFLHKVAILNDGKVLLLKRSDSAVSRPGCWDLPGGNSEWPAEIAENIPDLYQLDIAREIKEETGFETNRNNFSQKNLIYFSTFFEPAKQLYSLICGWKLTAVTDLTAFSPEKVILSAEHTQFVWVSAIEINNYNFGDLGRGDFIKVIIENANKI